MAILLPALAAAVPALPAGAADGSSSVNCSTGSSCEIMLEHMIHFGGKNYSPGAENTVVDITPPPCLWIPQGDAHAGSQVVIDFYNNTDPGPGALFDGQHAFQEAKQLVTQNPMPPGTWYELPVNPNDTQAQIQECLNGPLFFWDVPGAPLPGIQIPPQTLAQLALAKMNVPQAGKMILSPRSGNSYSNLPTFSRVTLSFRPEFGPGGLPYVTDNAQLGGRVPPSGSRPPRCGCPPTTTRPGSTQPAAATSAPPRWSVTRGRSPAAARTAPPTAASPSASSARGTSTPR